MPLTLLFPDTLIADPAPLRHPSVRTGQDLLARAHCLNQFDDDTALPFETPYERWLRRELQLPPAACLEAGSAVVDSVDVSQWRLTPVHLHVGIDHIVLADPNHLSLNQDQAQAFADAIAPTLLDAGMHATVAKPNRWYLSVPADFVLNARSWRIASGRSIDGFQPIGPSARRWRQVLTEIQMIWHQHPLNEERAQQGLPVLNSLWLDGRFAPAQRFDYDVCCTDLPGLRGIALNAQAAQRRALTVVPITALADLLPRDQRRCLVVFDPHQADPYSLGSEQSQPPPATVDAGSTERLSARWHQVTETLSIVGIRPALSDLTRSSSREPVRIVLTGDRRIVELRLGPWDGLAFNRQLDLTSLFESGERALQRQTP